jgi:hypothetical protein
MHPTIRSVLVNGAFALASAAGFAHPYGDYTETTTDGNGNFFSIWAEGESKLGSGDVYYAKY